MRAVLLEGDRLRVADIAEPEPRTGEVLVDVLACGICGSDLHCAGHAEDLNAACRAALGAEIMDLSAPVVFGHEFVGAIAGHGDGGARSLPAGERVVSIPSLVREPPVFLGYSGTDTPGAYCERMLLSEATLMAVPDHLSTEDAAMTEPLSVAYRSVRRADLGEHDVPLVVGCGPIGLAVIAILKLRGVHPIVAADFSAQRRELAGSIGADIVVDPAQTSPYASWTEAAATDDPERMIAPTALVGQLPIRPTVAFECVGVPGVIQEIVAGAPAASRIVVAGICMSADAFQPAQAVIKELDVRFAMMYTPDEFARTFAHLCDGEIDVSPLISASIGLDAVPDAFDRLTSRPADAKILIDPSRTGDAAQALPEAIEG